MPAGCGTSWGHQLPEPNINKKKVVDNNFRIPQQTLPQFIPQI
jgi:hypothetical protein